MPKFVLQLPLATKMTLLTVAGLFLLAIATFVVSDRALLSQAEQVATERQEVNMRVAWRVLRNHGAEFHVDGNDLYVGNRKLNDWDAPVDEVKRLVGGTATIFRGDMRIATNVTKPDGSRAVGTPLARNAAFDTVLGQGKSYRGTADILGKPYFTAYDPIKDASGKTIGILYVGIPKSDVFGAIGAARWSLALWAAAISLIVALGCWMVGRATFAPLVQMTGAMRSLAAGRVDAAIPTHAAADEIGAMAKALEHFRDNEIARQRSVQRDREAQADREQAMNTLGQALARVAHGDLTADVGHDFPKDYAALADHFRSTVASLRDLIAAVMDSASSISTGSTEIAQASEDLARRTEGAAASLEETSAAVSRMDERIKATAAAANQTVERATGAIRVVDSGRVVADEAMQAMTRVLESAKGIDSVIEGLDKIAFQTRVLAMNAAVEAGRAGEAGRGFAVVADLVSALAMRAEEEAGRARDQLTATQTDINAAVDRVTRVDSAFDTVVDNVGEVHKLLEAMAADNRIQALAVTEIATAVNSIDHTTQQNAAMVEETSAAARNLTTEVASLTDNASRFNTGRNERRANKAMVARQADARIVEYEAA